MLDEIQTGLGRTGKMFAFEHESLRPDVLILGKALGGGLLPVSAVVARREVLGVFEPGSHGSTFGGNPLACAVARKAIEILVRDRLAERAAELGAHALARLSRLAAARRDRIVEARGRGLLLGIELRPEAGGARATCERLMDLGVLCKETHEHVLRIAPPLVISGEDLDLGLSRIEQAF
jgi:ornithine--oxo-acid transaminase